MIAEQFLKTLKNNFPFTPTEAQEEALSAFASFLTTASSNDVLLLKGYAGTGKTTLVGTIVKSIGSLRYKTVLLAPTGRAAKVMAAYAKRTAYTIHKRIYFTHQERQGKLSFKLQKNKFKRTLFLVDEASMIADQQQQSKLFENGSLLHDLIHYVQSGEECRLLLVGDTAQLPPVHTTLSPALDTAVLSSEYGLVPSEVSLNQVVRQGQDSGILFNATRIRHQLFAGDTTSFTFSLLPFTDIIRLQDGFEIQDAIETAFREVGREETACIVRSNKRANGYNKQIRTQILGKEAELAKGDLVMVVKNNYHWLKPDSGPGFIANGDIVEVLNIKAIKELYDFRFAEVQVQMLDYPDEEPFDTVFILDTLEMDTHALSFDDNTKLYQAVREDYAHLPQYKQYLNVKKNPFFNALQVKYAYAFTCHKAQGGQWKRVIVEKPYLPDGLDAAFFRWLYTAVTRATEKLFLVGFGDDDIENN
ncbi:MAG: AAA family ATPase [Flavobacteriaceae bacterium]